MSDDAFDAIVVGGGPAGLAAALTMARAGLQVVLLERGAHPGAKNVMGGILYRHPTERLVPGFWKAAPLERAIIEQRVWMLGPRGHVGVAARSDALAGDAPNAFSVFRARFDNWLGEQAEAAGATVLAEVAVTGLLVERGRVVGVRTGRDEGDLRAPVVVIADGVNSILLRDLGVRGEIPPEHVATAVKEVISLPAEKIEDRFGVEAGQGVAIELMGDHTRGAVGLGFLYTNRESVSLGVGVLTADIARLGIKVADLLEGMKQHPSLRPLLAGGRTEEYASRLIPEGGYHAIPRVHGNGWVAAGDAAMLVNSVHREGSNLATLSGVFAGEAVIQAHRRGEFSEVQLASYRRALDDSLVMKDLFKYRGVSRYLHTHPRLFDTWPALVNDAAAELLRVDGRTKREKQQRILEMIGARRGFVGAALDAIEGGLILS